MARVLRGVAWRPRRALAEGPRTRKTTAAKRAWPRGFPVASFPADPHAEHVALDHFTVFEHFTGVEQEQPGGGAVYGEDLLSLVPPSQATGATLGVRARGGGVPSQKDASPDDGLGA